VLAKLGAAAAGFWQAACACLWSRPAIVHAHAASGASFARKSLVLLLARATGCRTIFHLHGGGFRQFATIRSGVLMRRWIRHTLERSTLVIALSEGWAGFVRGYAPRARVAVVPNAVVVPPQAAGRAEAGRILFLGRIEAAKGVADLLDAAALLAPRFPQLRLVLAGTGERDAWRQAAQARGLGDRVELPGWLDASARDAELARPSSACLRMPRGCRCPCWRPWHPDARWWRAPWAAYPRRCATARTACWCRRATRSPWPRRWRACWRTIPCVRAWAPAHA
jgi:glycosyltransferase involved in cell wall biosynthesis